MTIEEAAKRLMATYGRYGADENELIRLMQDGVQNYGLSTEGAYQGLRLMLGERHGIQELFSSKDVAAILNISEEEAAREIEAMKAKLAAEGEDMNKYIIPEPVSQWTS